MAKVAIYTRVSTADQTCANQLAELEAWARRSGHEIVERFQDAGISGCKGRDKRPGFDRMLKAAVRREFDLLAVWSSDRLGRSMQHLIEVLQTVREAGIGLYVHTQAPGHHDAGRAGAVSDARGIRRVRAGNDRGACQRWHGASPEVWDALG